ncbi:hypothetical protein QYF36_007806 [Acer negundo]|nr:hypothetical protein QYF36_007806 [Acer negundo]
MAGGYLARSLVHHLHVLAMEEFLYKYGVDIVFNGHANNRCTGPTTGKFYWDRQPDYSAFRESSFGHVILEVKNKTHALWTWHRNQDLYKSVAGDIIYIVRQPDRCPVEVEPH